MAENIYLIHDDHSLVKLSGEPYGVWVAPEAHRQLFGVLEWVLDAIRGAFQDRQAAGER